MAKPVASEMASAIASAMANAYGKNKLLTPLATWPTPLKELPTGRCLQ